jgi:hypothetical protein
LDGILKTLSEKHVCIFVFHQQRKQEFLERKSAGKLGVHGAQSSSKAALQPVEFRLFVRKRRSVLKPYYVSDATEFVSRWLCALWRHHHALQCAGNGLQLNL